MAEIYVKEGPCSCPKCGMDMWNPQAFRRDDGFFYVCCVECTNVFQVWLPMKKEKEQ